MRLTLPLQPRTQEIESFLGILDDVKKHSFKMQNVHFYDTAEPYQKLKSQRVIEEVQPTPEFPYVSCKHSVVAHSENLTRCL